MKIQPIIDWVNLHLSEHSENIIFVAVFGSIARNSDKPNDCDLLIVSSAKVDSEVWHSIRNRIKAIKMDFANKFSLTLNVALLTDGEWLENQAIYEDLILC